MEFYPQYRFEDFYRKHYWQGGLALSQVQALYKHAMERKSNEYRFYALLHGADLDKSSSTSKQSDNSTPSQPQQPANQSLPIFGDPESYKHMSKEERDELTNKMMSQHQGWARKGIGKANG